MRTTSEHLPLLHKGMLHAVGLTSELDEPAVVHDAVDDGRSHLVVPEHPSPAGELQVGRDDHALALVGVGEDLEDKARPVGVEWQEPELVDHEQAGAGDLRHLAVRACPRRVRA